ncbi:hypothetical protein D3C77_716820 [compost metagenome]
MATVGTPPTSTPNACIVSSTAISMTMVFFGLAGTLVSPRACLTGTVACATHTPAAALSANAAPA